MTRFGMKPGDPVKRFWAKVHSIPAPAHRPELGPCWIWTGACIPSGYGKLGRSGKTIYAHRWAVENEGCQIPPRGEIDHLCLTKACVRFSHLEVVTHQENAIRALPRNPNKSKTHCPSGHPYDEENTYLYETSRYCRQCQRDAAARWRASKREAA